MVATEESLTLPEKNSSQSVRTKTNIAEVVRPSRSGERRAAAASGRSYCDGSLSLLLNSINTSLLEKTSLPVLTQQRRSLTYKAKMVISGNHVQVYEYEKAIVRGIRPSKSTGRVDKKEREEKDDQDRTVRLDNVYRAVCRAKRLINANAGQSQNSDKFVTLTFAANEDDLARCNDLWHKFIKRLEYNLKTRVSYVAVPQIQWERFEKTGVKVWHYHVMFFGLSYVDNSRLRKIWKHGFVRINAIENIEDVGSYVSRYMEKDFQNEELRHHRRFLSSSGLVQPVEVDAHTLGDLPALPDKCKTFEVQYKNLDIPGSGWVKYKHYDLRLYAPDVGRERIQKGRKEECQD